jgi:3-hydroxyisobutyrate dehydrogenase
MDAAARRTGWDEREGSRARHATRKNFFFEKKKQKTFAYCVQLRCFPIELIAGRNLQKFFVFFSKKKNPSLPWFAAPTPHIASETQANQGMNMKTVFLGTGLMGTGFVRHRIGKGEPVTVWNRSPARAKDAIEAGATLAASAADAVRGATHVHVMLSDDASVDGVLEPIAEAIGADTWVVDHTTTAPTPTKARAERWAGRGRRFAHAPVFMTPAMCASGSGLMLLSGPQATYDALQPVLAGMTGTLVYMGEAPERASAFKLFGNLTLLAMMATLGDVNRLARACGIETSDAFSLFEKFNPGAMLPMRAARIASGDFTPSFEMTMARKDVRLMIEEAAGHGVELAVMPAVAALLDAAIARGDGAKDVSAAAA